jgi:hypothetical protein
VVAGAQKAANGVSFYTDVIQTDPRYSSSSPCRDMSLLEPGTRAAVEALIADAKSQGITLEVTETFRSQARQEQLYKEHLTELQTCGCHEYGVAADVLVLKDGKADWSNESYFFLATLAPAHGLVWGGNWGVKGDESNPSVFHDWDHLQSVAVSQQSDLFAGTWYPSPPEA